jgi:hypothetical protein
MLAAVATEEAVMAEATYSTAAEAMDFMAEATASMAAGVGIMPQAVATTVDTTDTTEDTTGIITMDITAVGRGFLASDGVIHGTGIRTIGIPTTAPTTIATMAATATHMLAMAITAMAVLGTTVATATMVATGTTAATATMVAMCTPAVMGMAAIGPAVTLVITNQGEPIAWV